MTTKTNGFIAVLDDVEGDVVVKGVKGKCLLVNATDSMKYLDGYDRSGIDKQALLMFQLCRWKGICA